MPPRWRRATRRRRQGEKGGTGSSVAGGAAPRRRARLAGAFDEALAEAALSPQSLLDPAHPPVVALVIVTEQVQKATDQSIAEIDHMLAAKEKEILTV